MIIQNWAIWIKGDIQGQDKNPVTIRRRIKPNENLQKLLLAEGMAIITVDGDSLTLGQEKAGKTADGEPPDGK